MHIFFNSLIMQHASSPMLVFKWMYFDWSAVSLISLDIHTLDLVHFGQLSVVIFWSIETMQKGELSTDCPHIILVVTLYNIILEESKCKVP